MSDIKRIQISGIRVPYGRDGNGCDSEALDKASAAVLKRTGVRPSGMRISKKATDARRGLSFVYTVTAEIPSGVRVTESDDLRVYSEPVIDAVMGNGTLGERPVIVGFGPAGMFAGLVLSKYGYMPLILERGSDVDSRTEAVERFMKGGRLDTETNVQFGAGGAGTFSDGKLTTRINDRKTGYVLKILNELGAPDDILYKSKPHIGTDILRTVVKNADRRIRENGGEIRYGSRAYAITDSHVMTDCGKIPFGALVLAIGHSARDTYGELISSGFAVEGKPFSVGVRIEHLQSDIDRAMFGDFAGDPLLGHAEYQLSSRAGGRGCYTFCMCPGGTVVPSSSSEGEIVTNGMSTRARDGRNANSAVCVSVFPEDYGKDPLKAIGFQHGLERKAFITAGSDYTAPVQTVGDFMGTGRGAECSRIVPTYMGGKVLPCSFEKIFPSFVTETMKSGLSDFGRKIKGFDGDYVPMTGVETRTSAPVRILRGEDLTAPGRDRIYPCGEGAGYAGGIVSAAVDGIRVALKIMERYGTPERK